MTHDLAPKCQNEW